MFAKSHYLRSNTKKALHLPGSLHDGVQVWNLFWSAPPYKCRQVLFGLRLDAVPHTDQVSRGFSFYFHLSLREARPVLDLELVIAPEMSEKQVR